MMPNGPVSKFCGQATPLMLLMNPHSQSAKDKKKLPIFLYECGQGEKLLDFRLASSDVEQIGVNDVHTFVDPNESISGCAQKLIGPANAIEILRSKIKFLINVVKESKEVRAD